MRIKVVDAVPVSKTDRIEVKDLKTVPNPSDKSYQNNEGVYAWDLDVKAGEKQEVTIEFTVSLPERYTPYGVVMRKDRGQDSQLYAYPIILFWPSPGGP